MTKVTIPNKFNDSSTLVITPSDNDILIVPEVHVHVTGDGLPMLNTRRTDFIAGVEEALGGIFIEDADLPNVTETYSNGAVRINRSVFGLGEDPAVLERVAKTYLAGARHIRANQPPPIDQEQVEAFNMALIEAEMDHADGPVPFKVAQDLVRLGYKITKEV